MMKIWEKLESKSSYHFPNSWWVRLVRGRLVPNTCHLKKLGRAYEDQTKPRMSELFDSATLEQFNVHATSGYIYTQHTYLIIYLCRYLFIFWRFLFILFFKSILFWRIQSLGNHQILTMVQIYHNHNQTHQCHHHSGFDLCLLLYILFHPWYYRCVNPQS